MKKLFGAILLVALSATHVSAQQDFSNQYLLKLRGAAVADGDLSTTCGSRIDIYVEYQHGPAQHVFGGEHGGGVLPFYVELFYNSNNKATRIITYGRSYSDGDWDDGCGGLKRGEGNSYTVLDTVTGYPVYRQTLNGKFIGYDFNQSWLSVDLQPLSKKSMGLTVVSEMRNNANQEFANDPDLAPQPPYTFSVWDFKVIEDYSLAIVDEAGNAEPLIWKTEERWNWLANESFSRQRTINYGTAPKLKSVKVHAYGDFLIVGYAPGMEGIPPFFLKESTADHELPIPSLPVPGTTTLPYILFPQAGSSNVTLTTRMYSLPIQYGPDDTYILPYDTANRVTILGPAWNAAPFYHWVYSTDGNTWKDLPAKFQGKHRLSISGYDLEGEDFMNNPVANRFFKLVVDGNGAESNILTLSGRISAPNIVNVVPLPDRCFDKERDGAFKITFSRPLLADRNGNREVLTILVRDLAANGANPSVPMVDVTLDATNSFTWPRGLQSDRQYEITLLDTYFGSNAYTGDRSKHYATLELIRPLPLSSVVTPSDVHCHGGADGKINLLARGGLGNYLFDYVRAETEDSVHLALGADTTAVALLLAPDTYFVRLRDVNGCGDRGGVKRVVIHQPAAPVRVGYSAITNPLGYGYTDGYIETIVTGGTAFPDKHYTVEWYDPTTLVPNALYNNAPLSEGYNVNLDSIGDGSYMLKAYDSQYALADPNHRAGCSVESEAFRVIQPPALAITMSEYHYVTCHGLNDGALLASAQGGVKMTGASPYQYEWLIEEDGAIRPITQADSIATALRAGTYRIRITDKNKVQKLSDTFFLVQPDVLSAQVTGTPVSCDSGINGTALATVQGGTLPYAYEWSDGSITPQIINLATGTYFVFVTDTRGCITTTSGHVPSPFPIQLDSVLRAPQCYGYANGAIDLTVAAGTAPYRYAWSTGATTEDVEGLTQGTYGIMVTDGNNCKSYHTYTLIDPAPVVMDLGGTRYLCNGQSYEADASRGEAGAQYQWTGPSGFTATSGSVTLTHAGTYHVRVTDEQGCDGEDNLELKQVTLDIQAEFVVSTQAFAATEITLLNISTTASDSVQWWASEPAAANYTLQEDKKAIVTFPNAGVYTLYMKAYRQGCEAVFSKKVTVLGTSFEAAPKTKSAFIETFIASPVPSDGAFAVTVTLQEVSSIHLRLISLGDNKVVDERTAQGSRAYRVPYTLDLAAGTYLLLLESADGNALLKVLIY
jgi:hypothetical protein